MRLQGRVAIVTGAAQGIGAEFAAALGREGAKVMVADMADPRRTVDRIAQAGGQAAGVAADISIEADCKRVVAEAVQRFGGIDILVNNAAKFSDLKRGSFYDITQEIWDRTMAVNARGPFFMIRAAGPEMAKRKYGKIVNITTGMVFMGVPYMLEYVASKGALDAMTRALARELGDDGIRINAIAPGFTMSENIEKQRAQLKATIDRTLANRVIKRDQMPDDLVGAMLFLAGPDSDFVTGQTIVVDGGYHMR
jgi:NAD(P)-dependent dehydrogenase (short-subunit alcohol dehydrogenase family)